jgi:excisionase family DNA binding protein
VSGRRHHLHTPSISPNGDRTNLTARLDLPPELVEAVAGRVAELLADRLDAASRPYLDVDEAAAYLRCSPQRIYDLVSAGRLRPHRDGRRVLLTREALDACLEAPEEAEDVAT